MSKHLALERVRASMDSTRTPTPSRPASILTKEKREDIIVEVTDSCSVQEVYSEWAAYTDEHNPEGLRTATDSDKDLRHIAGPVGKMTYLLSIVEFAERGSYYGLVNVISNYVQFPFPEGGNGWGASPVGTQLTPGALGKGLQIATVVTLVLQFLSYVAPLWGAWLADARYGRFNTIWAGTIVCGVGHVIIVIAGIPGIIEHTNASFGVFMVGLLVFAIGTGLFKPNILPLLLDQYREKANWVKKLPSGEEVVIDRDATLQRMTLVYYWGINIGVTLGIATAYSEKRVGFWLAFLIPTILYFLLPPLLWYVRKDVYKVPPSKSSVLSGFYGVLYQRIMRKPPTYSEDFVFDVNSTLMACRFFLFFPMYWINDEGIGALFNSQGASMLTNGVPNDLLNNFNPITIIVCIPIVDYIIYPTLRRLKINFRASFRMFLGFMLAAASSGAGAIIQWRVYETSPCGYYATECPEGVSHITIWWQVVPYFLAAVSEIFAVITSYELAYSLSPAGLESVVMSLLLSMSAVSTAIKTAITPALKDPDLIWPFVGIACGGVGFAVVFLICFWRLGKDQVRPLT
ncbi:POT family-domain-containing protein [Yarrowia lipolytica]|uniref:Peptide transporter PTR2 n=1 Tax=Yarrowia lipolytica TaxID=4952 RepID=A0A1D8N5D8_YARLL|nr:hypothetical protein YALI1_A19795g [Yarrowia lipolytica]KAB8283345.1 POT family-domain-containing protein [Yarrowia lipolytica]KAE8174112.1 POT family-domain-containing protein [Yarrowia lipolytica]KAJ8051809.1 POT family-domain-containing protein [Yarrowia lipolytica]RMI95514.1 POT family-domain-containing protein [Yarrowia lipolytica]